MVTLESVLQFITGSISIPLFGFDTAPSITFSHSAEDTLPTANTCDLSIRLPTSITDVGTFSSRMTFGIFNAVGFGQI